LLGLADWLAPQLSRSLFGANKRSYPITVAQWILSQNSLDEPEFFFDKLMQTASTRTDEFGDSWGLGFPWMSKNGLYDENMPFITHTPYALEALIRIYLECSNQKIKQKALGHFNGSRTFLTSLKVMYEDERSLALSYAPIDEPRIVVNANSYAGFAYALQSHFGDKENQMSLQRCEKLTQWVLDQQQENGSWFYYADNYPGNFIDGFHTCFVLKNLIKVSKLVPGLAKKISPVIDKGMRYLNQSFIDKKTGLLHRFALRDIKDPFVWDLYDQAEYLGLLILKGDRYKAEEFLSKIYRCFHKNGNWYCRKDFFGRLWGKNFLRWGVMPLFHQEHELNQLKREA